MNRTQDETTKIVCNMLLHICNQIDEKVAFPDSYSTLMVFSFPPVFPKDPAAL